MPDQDTMIYWVAHVCREMRKAHRPRIKALDVASRIRDHVARGESVDNSTISRFEKGTTWPRTPMDAIVAAYADEVGVEAIQIWQEALRLWHAHVGAEALSEADEATRELAELPQPGSALRRRGKAQSPNAPSRPRRANAQGEAS